MFKKTIALAALAAALAVTPAASADPAPYGPGVATETVIDVTKACQGSPVKVSVSASANSMDVPEGDIAVTISKSTSAARASQAVVAAPIFSTTVHYEGEPISITGPRLPKGRYIVSAAFTPDDGDSFEASDDTHAFRMGACGDVGAEDDGNGAGLPDTGGPNLMWLVLGGGLVAAGAGGVAYSRRRQGAAA